MAEKWTYRGEDGWTYASEDRAEVRREARKHRMHDQGETEPKPEDVDDKIARSAG